MSSGVVVPQIDRITYFSGELLTADDLSSAQLIESEMRWLHNRTMHGWGIATGLGVTSNKGARSVSISPGLAVDILGREIILADDLVKGIPSLAGGSPETMFYLTASYQADSAQKVLTRRAGICQPGGAVRLSNDPLIEWRTSATVMQGEQIILAAVWVNNCKISRAISGAPRRSLIPPKKPSVSSGQVSASNIAWTPWLAGQTVAGFTAAVDTSTAQFQDTPQFVTQIVGENYLPSSPGPLLVVPQTLISGASASGFTLRVLLPESNAGVPVNPPVVRDAQTGPAILKALGWQIAWMGVEG
jgi:hypothetical protein